MQDSLAVVSFSMLSDTTFPTNILFIHIYCNHFIFIEATAEPFCNTAGYRVCEIAGVRACIA